MTGNIESDCQMAARRAICLIAYGGTRGEVFFRFALGETFVLPYSAMCSALGVSREFCRMVMLSDCSHYVGESSLSFFTPPAVIVLKLVLP